MINKYLNTKNELLEHSISKQGKKRYDFLCRFMNPLRGNVLEIGERNPLTEFIEKNFNISVDNSYGDLNYELITHKEKYEFIICSHVIEHIPNVLTFLGNIKDKLSKDGKLILVWPVRLKKTGHHYHEIPLEDMLLLLDETGFEVERKKEMRIWSFNFGIRPLIRFFTDKDYYLMCKK